MEVEKVEVHQTRYPGFIKRAVADMVDSLVLDLAVVFLAAVFLGAFYWVGVLTHAITDVNADSFFKVLDSNWILALVVFLRGALSLFYYTWGHFRYGTTPGKWIFKIYVVSLEGLRPLTLQQSFVRTMSYLASYATFCCGFVMVIFNPQKRALHDLLAKTVSILRSEECV